MYDDGMKMSNKKCRLNPRRKARARTIDRRKSTLVPNEVHLGRNQKEGRLHYESVSGKFWLYRRNPSIRRHCRTAAEELRPRTMKRLEVGSVHRHAAKCLERFFEISGGRSADLKVAETLLQG